MDSIVDAIPYDRAMRHNKTPWIPTISQYASQRFNCLHKIASMKNSTGSLENHTIKWNGLLLIVTYEEIKKIIQFKKQAPTWNTDIYIYMCVCVCVVE